MQGLAHYADDSDSSPPMPAADAGPSRARHLPSSGTGTLAPVPPMPTLNRPAASPRFTPNPPGSSSTPSARASSQPEVPVSSRPGSSSPRGSKRRRSPSTSKDPEPDPEPEQPNRFEGMSEAEIFRSITMPPEIPGVSEWGIPPEVDASKADLRLRAKVSQYLRIKRQGQHINTSLLQSSSFANPHIYSKLVEFVDLNERATAFPNNGWLTRRGLESEIPKYGPKALTAQQTAMAEAVKRAQESGRKEISFTGARTSDRRERDDRRDRERQRDRDREHDRDRDREMHREAGALSRPKNGGWTGNERRRDRR